MVYNKLNTCRRKLNTCRGFLYLVGCPQNCSQFFYTCCWWLNMEDNRQDTDFINLEEYLEYLQDCAKKEYEQYLEVLTKGE